MNEQSTVLTASFTRPNDALIYQANDAVTTSTVVTPTNYITFLGAAFQMGRGGYVLTGRMVKSTNNITAATFRLWLYQSAPNLIPVDNAAFYATWYNRAGRIGSLDLLTYVQGSDCVEYYGTLNMDYLPYKTWSMNLFGVLQALGAYQPVANEQFHFDLGVYQV